MPQDAKASVAPALPAGNYTNYVTFNPATKAYDFYYSGTDETIKYDYVATSGTFNGLTCTVNGTNSFLPSNFGGLQMLTGSGVINPWQGGTYTLLSSNLNNNVLTANYEWNYNGTKLDYTLSFQINGRTLKIQAAVTSGISPGIPLDRCENASNPIIVYVPYMMDMNFLKTGGAFVSMYFDWETTKASTIVRRDSVYSSTSVYYAQQNNYNPRTDGSYVPLNETIYLTASTALPDVFPSVPNPVSPYKSLSGSKVIFDEWVSSFGTANQDVKSLAAAGVSNLWVILHPWQNQGFDNGYPDVLPPNPGWGGSNGLAAVSQTAAINGYLFGLHENYDVIFTNAASWNPADVALNGNGSWIALGLPGSFLIKPPLAAGFLTNFAPQIHSQFNTTAAYLDVSPGMEPSDKVDYDINARGAGQFTEVLNDYRAFGPLLRGSHQGPVSGEGYHNFYYAGYFDDHEAAVNSGSSSATQQYSYLAPMVDFDLLKLHNLELVHGVGYYEWFFPQGYVQYPYQQYLQYVAMELVYGHGAFVPTSFRVYNFDAAVRFAQDFVLPVQQLYANANVVSIKYHDPVVGDELSVSDYIRRYPTTFEDYQSSQFMSQVRVTYDNGVVVCVNRHPSTNWQVKVGQAGGYFDYNAIVNGTNVQLVGQSSVTNYLLPALSGWVVFTTNVLNAAQPIITQMADDGAGASAFTGMTNWTDGQVPHGSFDYSTCFDLQTPSDTAAHTFGGRSLSFIFASHLYLLGTNVITVTNLIFNGGNGLVQAGTGKSPDYARLAGTINLPLGTAFDGGASSRTLEIDASIGGSGNLTTKTGGSTIILAGASNTFSGTLYVQNNVTIRSNLNSCPAIVVQGGNLNTTGPNLLGDNASVTINTGSLTLGGNDTVGQLTASGGGINSGAGTLTAQSYNLANMAVNRNLGYGTLNINSSTTTLNGTSAAATVNVAAGSQLTLGSANRLSTNATVNLNGVLGLNGNNTVAALAINGVFKTHGTYGAAGSGAANTSASFSGLGILTVTGDAPPPPPNFMPGGIVRFMDGNIMLTCAGVPGMPYRLWTTTNLAGALGTNDWTLLKSGTISSNPFTLSDPAATNSQQQFYRLTSP